MKQLKCSWTKYEKQTFGKKIENHPSFQTKISKNLKNKKEVVKVNFQCCDLSLGLTIKVKI